MCTERSLNSHRFLLILNAFIQENSALMQHLLFKGSLFFSLADRGLQRSAEMPKVTQSVRE